MIDERLVQARLAHASSFPDAANGPLRRALWSRGRAAPP